MPVLLICFWNVYINWNCSVETTWSRFTHHDSMHAKYVIGQRLFSSMWRKKMAHWHKNTAAKHHFLDPLMRLNCTIVSAYLFKWDIPVCGCCQITSKHAVPQHTTLHLSPFYWWLMKESKNCSWNYLFVFFPIWPSVCGLQELVIYLAKLNSSPKKSYFHSHSKVIFSNPPLLSFMKHGKFHEYASVLEPHKYSSWLVG